MKTGIIKTKSFVNCSFRFDPDIHLSEGVQVRQSINNLPYEISNIGENAEKVFYGNIFSRVFVEKPEFGVPYLAASDTILSELETGKYISKKQADDLEYLKLEKDWILITCSGTLGNVSYTNNNYVGRLATHDLIRVIPNDNKVLRGVLYAFLAGKYGYHQITQSQFGGVVKHVNEEQTKDIMVPVFPKEFQNKIDLLIKESSSLREQATKILKEATQYFDNMVAVKREITKTFTKNVKSLKKSWAAYNNNLEVTDGVEQYKEHSIQLKDVTSDIFAPPMFKHIYLSKDNGYPFMTGGELVKQCMRYYRWLSPRGVKNIKDYVVDKDTLLIYRHGSIDGGMNGQVFIVDDALRGCCLSDLIIRVKFFEPKLALWAFAFFKSAFGRRYLLSFPSGTAIPFMAIDRIEDAYIPSPDHNFDKIVEIVRNYMTQSALSKKKEIEAIELVEQEIEKWNN